MTTIQTYLLEYGWVGAFVLLASFQYLLFLKLSAGQRRHLQELLQILETRIRHLSEAGKTELESGLQRLSEEQRQSVDSLKSRLVESELRRHTGMARTEVSSGGRLDKRHQVMSLAHMGFDSKDIARKLRLSRGETELLLGLCEQFVTMETSHAERAV